MTTVVDGGALSPAEQEAFEFLRLAVSQHGGLALVRSALDGQPCAVVAVVDQEDDDDVLVTPLAVLLTDDLMARLTDPTKLGPRALYREGDRDPTPDQIGSGEEWCDAEHPVTTYRCTWPLGHPQQQHVAGGSGLVCKVWPV